MDQIEYAEAVKKITDTLKEDRQMYYAWQANIAMCIKDAFSNYESAHGKPAALANMHTIANNGAVAFLDLLCKEQKVDETDQDKDIKID